MLVSFPHASPLVVSLIGGLIAAGSAGAQEPSPRETLRAGLAAARAADGLGPLLSERWYEVKVERAPASALHLCRTRGELLPGDAGLAFEVRLVEARKQDREESTLRLELGWDGELRGFRRLSNARWRGAQVRDAGSTLVGERAGGELRLRVETADEEPRPVKAAPWDERTLPMEVALFLLPLLPAGPGPELRFVSRDRIGLLAEKGAEWVWRRRPGGGVEIAEAGEDADEAPRGWQVDTTGEGQERRVARLEAGSLSLGAISAEEAARRLAAEQGK